MIVYNILLGLLFFLYILTFSRYWKSHSLWLLIVAGVVLFSIAAFRSVSVGTDTESYYNYFYNIELLKDDRIYTGLQRGWYHYTLFFYRFFDFQWFLIANYTIIIGGFCYFLYKKSTNCVASILLFFLLYFFFSSLNVMRQYMAISIVLVALTFLDKNKLVFCGLVILASFFHFSALICLMFLFVQNRLSIHRQFYVIVFVVLSFLLGFVFENAMKTLVSQITIFNSLNEGAASYIEEWGGERNIVTNMIINLMFIFSYLLAKDRSSFYLKLYFLFIILNNIFGSAGQGNRIFLYFNVGMLIAFPEISSKLKNISLRGIYNLAYVIYAYAIWYVSISSNSGEVVPYSFF